MVNKNDLLELFIDELETAVSSLSTVPEVIMGNTDDEEDIPCVCVQYNSRDVTYNSTIAPSGFDKNQSGEITGEYYLRNREIDFNLDVRCKSELNKGDVFDAIETHFDKYISFLHYSDFHEDVEKIDVETNNSNDNVDSEYVIHGDLFVISIIYGKETLMSNDLRDTGAPIRKIIKDVEGKTYVTDGTN